MRQRSRENGLLGEPPPLGDVTAGAGSDGLNAALGRCADGDRQGLDELRAWEGGRLQAMVLRMVGDPALAEQVLEAALADIYRNAGMLVTVGQGPSDDRVFALVRRHAYAALRTREHQSVAPPRPPPAAPPHVSRETEVVAVAPLATDPPVSSPSPLAAEAPEEPEAPVPVALGVATRLETPRVRRPGLRDEAEGSEDEVREEGGTGRRRWVWAAFAWTTAALFGFGVAVLVAGRLGVEAPAPITAPPAAVEAPPTPPRVDPAPTSAPGLTDPRAPQPSPRELLGEPLQAPEPAALSIPPPRPAPAPPSVVQAPAAATVAAARPPASPSRPADLPTRQEQAVRAVPPPGPGPDPAVPDTARLFIHHSAGDPTAASRARALAQRLQQRGANVVIVRPVPFGIRGLSVRYFHSTDRPGAAAVLGDVAALGGGRAATARPADFTGFQPAPRPGTIEIWLPGGA